MSKRSKMEGLSPENARMCGSCGATVWIYTNENGNGVALENVLGPYVIEDGRAYRSGDAIGFRDHWEVCEGKTATFFESHISDDEWLWP
jgi:hypothetical protein